MNGAGFDRRRMGHGRNLCVTLKVACAYSRARSYEEMAAPCCMRPRKLSRQDVQTQSQVTERSCHVCAPSFASAHLGALLLLACLTFSACVSAPVEETVTLDASRLSALPAKAPTVAVTPQLPARDEDIEAAGDRIAEAITSLSKRRGTTATRNMTPTLRALEQAEAALTRALHDKPHDEPVREALRAALRDLSAAQRTIQRNAYADAIRDLNTLNKRLDTLHGAEDSKL